MTRRRSKKVNKIYGFDRIFIYATIWSVILWSLIFAEVTVLMFFPVISGIDAAQKSLQLILTPVLVGLCTKMFFKTTKAKPSINYGFYLGLYFLAIGTVLDLLITIPMFVPFGQYYGQWTLWLSFALSLTTATLVGGWLKNNKK